LGGLGEFFRGEKGVEGGWVSETGKIRAGGGKRGGEKARRGFCSGLVLEWKGSRFEGGDNWEEKSRARALHHSKKERDEGIWEEKREIGWISRNLVSYEK